MNRWIYQRFVFILALSFAGLTIFAADNQPQSACPEDADSEVDGESSMWFSQITSSVKCLGPANICRKCSPYVRRQAATAAKIVVLWYLFAEAGAAAQQLSVGNVLQLNSPNPQLSSLNSLLDDFLETLGSMPGSSQEGFNQASELIQSIGSDMGATAQQLYLNNTCPANFSHMPGSTEASTEEDRNQAVRLMQSILAGLCDKGYELFALVSALRWEWPNTDFLFQPPQGNP